MPTIAIAGFQHETNSFGAGVAGLPEFEMADSWPAFLRGGDVITGTKGLNLPIAGFAQAARKHRLHPISWCAAEPSGPVTDDAFETITGGILKGLAEAPHLDALYLDLHGAMITDTHDDGEGALLASIRQLVGPDMPIAISLDMHANVSQSMVDLADVITIYRTYPHLDMAETGARAFHAVEYLMTGARFAKAFRQIPYIIPMHAQYTGDGAMKSLYDAARNANVELAVGFTGGDMADTGPSVVAYASDQATADSKADVLFEKALAAERAFDCHLPSAEAAVRKAMSMRKGKPVIIADVQDNPGGGTSSDTTGMLRALVSEGAKGALLGVMHDPSAARLAHEAGVGAILSITLGGKSGRPGDSPFEGRFRVDALSDGRVTYEGEMYGGGFAEIGPSAVLSLRDTEAEVKIVVSSVRNQCLDRGYFRHIGLTPEDAQIIVVKSTVHYRADFEPIAQAVISAGAPGALNCKISSIPYRKLRPNVRLGPLGPIFGQSN